MSRKTSDLYRTLPTGRADKGQSVALSRESETKGYQMITSEVSKDNKKLIITCDLETPTPSASGKTLVVASTRGNQKTTCMVQGKPVTLGLNAYISR